MELGGIGPCALGAHGLTRTWSSGLPGHAGRQVLQGLDKGSQDGVVDCLRQLVGNRPGRLMEGARVDAAWKHEDAAIGVATVTGT